jgi:hypothetical protein
LIYIVNDKLFLAFCIDPNQFQKCSGRSKIPMQKFTDNEPSRDVFVKYEVPHARRIVPTVATNAFWWNGHLDRVSQKDTYVDKTFILR